MAPEEDQMYVRVDGHEEILNNLSSIERVINNINEASKVLKEVREIKEQALDMMYSNVQELNENLENIDMEMPEIEGQESASIPQSSDIEIETDSSVDEIHNELQNLQKELSQLGN
ncbi:hypothetical protein ACK3SF_04945 [Candidatus Nanosalina sp. VS9-1]|uniref:hypothetical protein n=1 Tax=Candidatus Nanosalina sp. VS9-1 TaxID=3388566 RepID=UPI0039DFB3F0